MNDRGRDLAGAGPGCGRAPLVDAITMFLARDRARGLAEIRGSVERAIDDAGPGALAGLAARLGNACADWGYYPGDPLARRIHHALAERVLEEPPQLSGAEHLERVRGEPVVILPNHLSYSDANLLEVVFHRHGAGALSDRLTVVAGPKVYSSLRRRFSSLCFGTIRTPQNSGRSSEEAVMTTREVAMAARTSIGVARDRLRRREAVLIFAEGTRSRSGRMQRLLPGVARYLDVPGTWVLPVGITGTERLFPMTETALVPAPLTVRIGRPIPAAALAERAAGNRRLIVDAIGLAIAGLLPPEYRGVYQPADFQDARSLLSGGV